MAIIVHGASKLQAAQFVAAIKASSKVPKNYKAGFSAKGNRLLVTINIRFPGAKPGSNVQVANWYKYVDRAADVKATQNNVWYITTGAIVGLMGGFLPTKARFKGVGEPTSIRADLPARQLKWMKPQKATTSKPSQAIKTPGQSVPARPTPGTRRLDFTKRSAKSGAATSGKALPKTSAKPSLGSGTLYAPSQAALTDALGICIVHHNWPDAGQSPIGHLGVGGLLVVANRVDAATFKNKRDATTMKRVASKALGETTIHEMIHAGIYANGTKQWLGHPSSIFGPFLI